MVLLNEIYLISSVYNRFKILIYLCALAALRELYILINEGPEFVENM
jgi:hypothetical protein